MQIHGKLNPTLSAAEAIELALAGRLRLLDVRAPVEFSHGHLPGSFNSPILNDTERQRVGATYKEQGQEAAIALGLEMVGPFRVPRVESWKAYLKGHEFAALTCWRGGLRSSTTQSWLTEAGVPVPRVEGGYKAMRALLLRALESNIKGIVISGMTGSGKTAFLRRLESRVAIDLEGIANHRGSAFGGMATIQPAQQTFENALGLALYDRETHVILEDESRLIGRCVLPEPFFSQMSRLPRIELQIDLAQRVENIFREYVEEPHLHEGSALAGKLTSSLLTLRNRLGGADTQEILEKMKNAFAANSPGQHRDWIEALLVRYYDRVYEHSVQKKQPVVLFRGKEADCAEWLEAQGYLAAGFTRTR